MVDSDGDHWDDAIEDDIGTKPLKPDTDNDGLIDSVDDDPFVPVPKPSAFETAIQLSREAGWVTDGFIYGETGIKDGTQSHKVSEDSASSASYFVGWMGSGVLVFGNIRDVGESVLQRDLLGTGLNVAGFVPLFGDGEKVGKNSAKVVLKYPAKSVEIFKGLVKYGTLDVVPEEHLPGIIDMYLRGSKDKFIKNGVTGKDLLYITKKGKLEETLEVIKRSDGSIVWLENGNNAGGWTHIVKKHITGEISGGTLFPNTMNQDQVKDLVISTVTNPSMTKNVDGTMHYYHEMIPPNGKYIHVVSSQNGYIKTAIMVNTIPL
jgi:hypothetical protein